MKYLLPLLSTLFLLALAKPPSSWSRGDTVKHVVDTYGDSKDVEDVAVFLVRQRVNASMLLAMTDKDLKAKGLAKAPRTKLLEIAEKIREAETMDELEDRYDYMRHHTLWSAHDLDSDNVEFATFLALDVPDAFFWRYDREIEYYCYANTYQGVFYYLGRIFWPRLLVATLALEWAAQHPLLLLYLWVHGIATTFSSYRFVLSVASPIMSYTRTNLFVSLFLAFGLASCISLAAYVLAASVWYVLPAFLVTILWYLRVYGGILISLIQFLAQFGSDGDDRERE